MTEKLNDGLYMCLEEFMIDLKLIVKNAQEYNPRYSNRRGIAHAAANMEDSILSYAHRFKQQQGYDLFSICREIATKRRKSKCKTTAEQWTPSTTGVRLSKRLRGISAPLVDLTADTTTNGDTTSSAEQVDDGSKLAVDEQVEEQVVVEEQVAEEEEDEMDEESEKENIAEDVDVIQMFFGGDEVFVASRMTPGINKPGGAGFITHWDEECDEYTVKYVLGGTERGIERKFVSILTENTVVDSLDNKQKDTMTNKSGHDNDDDDDGRKTDKEMKDEHFDVSIWPQLEVYGWTRTVTCNKMNTWRFQRHNDDEDCYDTRQGVLTCVKMDKDLSMKCFGRRYVADHFTLLSEEEEGDNDADMDTTPDDTNGSEEVNEEMSVTTTSDVEAITEVSSLSSDTELVVLPDFIVNKEALVRGLEDVAIKTEGWHVDELYALYIEFEGMIRNAQDDYDRTALTVALGKRINLLVPQ